MKLLKLALAGVAGLVVVGIAVGLLLPSAVHVERSVLIDAPACNVYAVLDNYKRFNEWSPWADLDPATKYTWSGPESGVGARLAWTSSDDRVGNGQQTVDKVVPCSEVSEVLEFEGMDPSKASFLLRPAKDGGVSVTWTMDATFGYNLIGRYFGTQMDAMIGPDYEKGLASLKSLVERLPKTDLTGFQPEIVTASATPILFVSTKATHAADDWARALGAAYQEVGVAMEKSGLTPAGPPVAIITAESDDLYAIDAGVPFAGSPPAAGLEGSNVRVGATPQGRALKVVHKGAYAGLEPLRQAGKAYLDIRQMKRGGPMWEVYVSDPGTTAAPDVETDIYILVASP